MRYRIIFTALIAVIAVVFILFMPAFADDSELEAQANAQSDTQTTAEAPSTDTHFLCWVEFKANVIVASEKFYTDVFGWQLTPYEPEPNYRFFTGPAGIMGGLVGGIPEDAQGTVVYIYVPDIDAALVEIEAAGGSRCGEKMPIEEEGFVGFFTDPNGVMWGLADMYYAPEYTPNPFGEGDKPVVNSICFFEFNGKDLAKTGEFFSNLFGWKAPVNPEDPNHLVFNTGAGTQGVFIPDTEGIPVLAYIWVDDVAATLEKVEAAGGERYMEQFTPEHVGITFGYFYDPSGVLVGLLGKG